MGIAEATDEKANTKVTKSKAQRHEDRHRSLTKTKPGDSVLWFFRAVRADRRIRSLRGVAIVHVLRLSCWCGRGQPRFKASTARQQELRFAVL